MNRDEVIETAEKYYLPVFGRQKLVLDHGKGCHVWDKNGKEYIDFLAGIAVNSLGYAHPAQVKAITEQAGKLVHCSNIFYTEIQAQAVRYGTTESRLIKRLLSRNSARKQPWYSRIRIHHLIPE